ncbi:DNA polymerase III subunit delta' [Litorimonas sp. RW-G-Af-16]|uniref:DNA polymerase III subunit delta' n=1 Tax=Litorimonas sp. RW-G-Af-16 TaxID=3241168 RepID=UPI00390CCEEB
MRQAEIETFPEADCADGCLHPRHVYDLIGHADAEARFIKARQSGRLHHAWLITGAPGIGKATLAYRIIRYMLGGESLLTNSLNIPASDPVAQRIAALGHENFKLIRRPYDHKTKKIKTEIPVDEVRALSTFFQKTAGSDSGWRVCLIDRADELNRNSENAILKLLEEPPERTLFILLSSAPGQLLPTIRSRCMALELRPVPKDDIGGWLSHHIDASEEIKNAAIGLSRGAPGKALALARNSDTVLIPLSRFLSSLGSHSHSTDMTLAKTLAMQSNLGTRDMFWEGLADILQHQAVFSVTGEWTGAFKPLPVAKSPQTWAKLSEQVVETQQRESAINLDKIAAMFDTLSAIRTA